MNNCNSSARTITECDLHNQFRFENVGHDFYRYWSDGFNLAILISAHVHKTVNIENRLA